MKNYSNSSSIKLRPLFFLNFSSCSPGTLGRIPLLGNIWGTFPPLKNWRESHTLEIWKNVPSLVKIEKISSKLSSPHRFSPRIFSREGLQMFSREGLQIFSREGLKMFSREGLQIFSERDSKFFQRGTPNFCRASRVASTKSPLENLITRHCLNW